MGALVWVMMAIAIWHFTIFLPDRWWAGIIGAFIGAVVGAIVFGLVVHGGSVPDREQMDLTTALEAIPGTLLGLGVVWLIGSRQERRNGLLHG